MVRHWLPIQACGPELVAADLHSLREVVRVNSGKVDVTAGSLDDPNPFPPTMDVFGEDRLDRVETLAVPGMD